MNENAWIAAAVRRANHQGWTREILRVPDAEGAPGPTSMPPTLGAVFVAIQPP